MKKWSNFFFALGIAFLLMLILSKVLPFHDINSDYTVRGEYEPELKNLSDIESFTNYIEAQLKSKEIESGDTAAVVEAMNEALEKRFYHGTARFNLSDDWIAYSLGAFVWDDLRMIVVVDDLMKKNVLACNQICIVFQKILSDRAYTHRSVGLNSHMITEVFYMDSWHVYDPDYEPNVDHLLDAEAMLKDREYFQKIYRATPGKLFNPYFEEILKTKQAVYYEKNTELAQNLRTFQLFSGLLSHYAWMIFIGLGLLLRKLKEVTIIE